MLVIAFFCPPRIRPGGQPVPSAYYVLRMIFDPGTTRPQGQHRPKNPIRDQLSHPHPTPHASNRYPRRHPFGSAGISRRRTLIRDAFTSIQYFAGYCRDKENEKIGWSRWVSSGGLDRTSYSTSTWTRPGCRAQRRSAYSTPSSRAEGRVVIIRSRRPRVRVPLDDWEMYLFSRPGWKKSCRR